MRVQGFDKGILSPQCRVVTIQFLLPDAAIVHPEAEALVADKLSRFDRLINGSVLSCFPLCLELQDNHLTWKNSTAIITQPKKAALEGRGLYPNRFGQINRNFRRFDASQLLIAVATDHYPELLQLQFDVLSCGKYFDGEPERPHRAEPDACQPQSGL
jgi:hypothetical protein